MIERTITCDFDNGQKAYVVMPDADGKTIHIVRGTVYETIITVNPDIDYEFIEYGVKYFDEKFKRNSLIKVAHNEIYKTPEAALFWGKREYENIPTLKEAKFDTWPADEIKKIQSYELNKYEWQAR